MESYIPLILENFLGESKTHSEPKSQISFNCPECDEGQNKGNLEINYKKSVFKCWACKETNNMYGGLVKLIHKYGSKDDLKNYKLLKPIYDRDEIIVDLRVLEVPEGLTPISKDPENYKAKKIKTYLNDRGINDDIIKKFSISFTNKGFYRNRLIIPSFDSNKEIEYFVSRAFEGWVKPKYKNPDLDKELIIFFENKINWDATIYLVEGVFDAMVIPNAIPMLGKYASDKLFFALQEKAKADIIIILDGDAISDAKNLYVKLNTLNLYNRIKIVTLGLDWDLASINEKLGKKYLFTILKSAKKLKESQL